MGVGRNRNWDGKFPVTLALTLLLFRNFLSFHALPNSVRFVFKKIDVTAMRKPVKQCSRHLFIAEQARPFAEFKSRCQNKTGPLISD